MPWPNETSVTTGTTAGGTAWRSARVQPNGSTDRATVCAPIAVQDGSPIKLVVATHGTNGSDATMDSGNGVTVRDALLDAGYIVVAAQLHVNTWGNSVAHSDLLNLYSWCAALWNVTDVMLFGQSQGGGVVFSTILRNTLPNVRAVAALSPAINFQWVSDFGSSSTDIRTAYGADANSFVSKSAGYAPFSGTADSYAGMHFRLWASNEDTTTPKQLHADKFVSLGLAGRAASCEVVSVTGAHLSADHYRPADVVAFYDYALTVGNIPNELPIPFAVSSYVPMNGEQVLRTPRVWDGTTWVLRSTVSYL